MARESSNGGDPASQPPKNGGASETDEDGGGTAFERFERLTRKLVNTPKSEVDEQLERAKRQKHEPTRS